MATYIKTLKEDNGDITYPQTVGGAVLLTGGNDLETTLAAKANTADLAGVATTGSYNDLTNKPTIPAAQVQSNWTQTTTTAVDYIKNKPTIPTVNNATLTIQKNGTTVNTFTANASSNVTANITVPTNTDILNLIYPVGSIYMSATLSTAAAVGTALGGTWVAWGAGRVPVGVDTTQTEFDTVEETGGEKTHTLILDEIPSHRHTIPQGSQGKAQNDTSGSSGYAWNANGTYTSYNGGGLAHNNLQPYITCYMYKRTA